MKMELSDKSRAILEAIAMGQSYEQILKQDASLRYPDISKAAAEAWISSTRRKLANRMTSEWHRSKRSTPAHTFHERRLRMINFASS